MANGGDVIIHLNIEGSRTTATQEAHPFSEDAGASPGSSTWKADVAGDTAVAGDSPIDALHGGISDEEAYNSYIGQRGSFTVNPQKVPDEWTYVTTNGAFAFHDRTHGFQVGGDAGYGANVPADLHKYLQCNLPFRLFSTEKDFAALVPVDNSNRLIVWGASINPTKATYPLGGIRSVYANRHAFAFIYEKSDDAGHRIGAIGNDNMGGKIPDDLHLKLATDEPESIRAAEGAFVVLTRSGKVYAWGDRANGGTIPADVTAVLARMKVRKIFATAQAFCAVDEHGEPVAWGNAQAGGTLPAVTMEAILDDDGIETVIAAQSAFCCITKRRRKAVAWGATASGGSMHASAASFALTGDVVACKASAWAFCAVNRSGQAEAWGRAGHGGSFGHDIENAVSSATTEGATTQQAEIEQVLEGGTGDINRTEDWTGPSFATGEWTAHLYAVDSGFCLITTTTSNRIRSVTCWGATDTLPSQVVRQVLLGSHLTCLVTGNRAYVAIVRQGTVNGRTVVWGETATNGGVLPDDVQSAMASGAGEIHAINRMPIFANTTSTNVSGFIARCVNGAVVIWGRAAGKLVLLPDT